MKFEKIESSKLLRDPPQPHANKITKTMKPLHSPWVVFLRENGEYLSQVHETHQREGMNLNITSSSCSKIAFIPSRLHFTQVATSARRVVDAAVLSHLRNPAIVRFTVHTVLMLFFIKLDIPTAAHAVLKTCVCTITREPTVESVAPRFNRTELFKVDVEVEP
jgi:hypothetical protein